MTNARRQQNWDNWEPELKEIQATFVFLPSFVGSTVMRNPFRIVVISMAFVVLSACGTTQSYEGPKRSNTETSVLKPGISTIGGFLPSIFGISIEYIDHKDIRNLTDNKVELIPGEHIVVVNWKGKDEQRLSFVSHAGHDYTVRRSDGWAECDIRWWIVDDEADQVVAERTKCHLN